MNEGREQQQPNVWHAPKNAQSDALRDVRLVAPSPEAATALEARLEQARARACVYETPVTDETLRQKVS
jgi:hypothetical protein